MTTRATRVENENPESSTPSPSSSPEPTSRLSVFWRELSTFGFIGVLNFVIDIGLFNVFRHHGPFEGKITAAKLASGAIATVFAWIGNRYWTFRHRDNRPVHHEVLLFFVVNGVALAVTSAWVAFAHYALGASSSFWVNVNAVIGIGIGTIVRFIAYRTVVFGSAAEEGSAH